MKSNSIVFNFFLIAGACGCVSSHNVEERLCALEKKCGLVGGRVDAAVRAPVSFREKPSLASLEPQIPFAEAVELAKKKDGKGYFALAVSYYYGDDVQVNEDIAKHFFAMSAGTGNINAEFALALMSEKEHERIDGVRMNRNGQENLLYRYGAARNRYQSLPASVLLNRGNPLLSGKYLSDSSTLPPLTNAVEVAALRDRYALFLQKGIAYASNEVVRCDEWLWGYTEWMKRRNEKIAEKEAKEKEGEKNNLLVEKLIPQDLWIASTNTAPRGILARSRPKFNQRRPAANHLRPASPVRENKTTSIADLEPQIPFAEAVELAKKKDSKGYFALAVSHYYGTDVHADEDVARYFFSQAAETGDENAKFVMTLLSEKEHAIFNGVRIPRNGQDNIPSRSVLLNGGSIDRNRYQSLPTSTLLYGGTQPSPRPLLLGQAPLRRRRKFQRPLAPLTNAVDVVALRDKYQSFVKKGIGCASNEVVRCDEWLWGHAEWCKKKVAEMEAMKVETAERKEQEELLSKNKMLVEQLIPKDLWIASTNVSGNGANSLFGSRAKRAQRRAEETSRAEKEEKMEQERALRDSEREEQRKQLLLIQEELKKARMARESSAEK